MKLTITIAMKNENLLSYGKFKRRILEITCFASFRFEDGSNVNHCNCPTSSDWHSIIASSTPVLRNLGKFIHAYIYGEVIILV